jgi:hypothetical protein
VAPAVAAYELGVERQLLTEAMAEMGKTSLQVTFLLVASLSPFLTR